MTVLALGVFAAMPGTAHTQDLQPGSWSVRKSYLTAERIPLAIELERAGWKARQATQQARFRSLHGDVDVRFPDNSRLRGRLSHDSATIDGLFIQTPRRSATYRSQSVGKAPDYQWATPVSLKRTSVRTWSGDVVPLEDRLTLELHFRRRGDGLWAFLRNPEYNFGIEREFAVRQEGARIVLTNMKDSTDVLRATYDAGSQRIGLILPEVDDTLALTPMVRALPATYVYRAPRPQADGWPTANLGEVGMDSAQIVALVQRILNANANTTSVFSPDVHSLIIARHGKLVVEEYFGDFDSERPHDSRSLFKTFAALLVGAARRDGVALEPSTPVLQYYPEYGATAQPDARKNALQLRHFMTMTTGLACDDNDDQSPGNEGALQLSPQKDWDRYMLDLPMVAAPGRKWAYCSGATNTTGNIVERATRSWLPAYFDTHIATPLDFQRYYMQLTPLESLYMGGGSYFRPRDMLKLGQVFLNGGAWNGRRLIDRDWAALATSADTAVNAPGEGYHWHLTALEAYGREWREWNANGNGGQMVLVYPELDLVVGWTAGNYMNGGTWLRYRRELTGEYIIPAAARR